MNFQLFAPIVGMWIILGIVNHTLVREAGGEKFDSGIVLIIFILLAPLITLRSIFKAFF